MKNPTPTTLRDLYQAFGPDPETAALLRPVFENVVAEMLKDGRQPREDEIYFVVKAFAHVMEAGRRTVSAIEALYRATGDVGPDGLDTGFVAFLDELEALEKALLAKLWAKV